MIEAVGVAYPVIAFIDEGEGFEKYLSVLVILEDGLLFVLARRYVIHSAGVLRSEGRTPKSAAASFAGRWIYWLDDVFHLATIKPATRAIDSSLSLTSALMIVFSSSVNSPE